jgi:hypothetical protein
MLEGGDRKRQLSRGGHASNNGQYATAGNTARQGPIREHQAPLTAVGESFVLDNGDTDMGDKGSKDKGKREKQKKAQRTPKEKRRLKKAKKDRQANILG